MSDIQKKLQIGWELPDEVEHLGPMATLSREDMIYALTRLVNNEISEPELYEWAETLNGRQMGVIDFERGYWGEICSIINTISIEHVSKNPITKSRAERYIRELKSAKFDEDEGI